MKLHNAVSAVGILAFLLCWLLYLYFPAVPHSVLGWVALVGLGLPVWFFLEWLGTAVLGSRFFARRSSGFRILVGVPVCLVLVVISMICVRLVQGAIAAT